MGDFICFAVLTVLACIPETEAERFGVYVANSPTPYVGNQVIISADRFSGIQITYPVGSPHYAPVLNDPTN